MNRLGQRGRDRARLELRRLRRARSRVRLAGARDRRPRSRRHRPGLHRRPTAQTDGPVLIVARTLKGKGVSFVENKEGWHGKALSADEAKQALAELGGERHAVMPPQPRAADRPAPRPAAAPLALPALRARQGSRDPRRRTATRCARSARRGRRSWRSTARSATRPTPRSSPSAYPDRFFEMYIAEQQIVAAAVGLQVRGYVPFASTFAAFFTRAYDFIRMAAISRANLRLCGSHAGVQIGEDGPSQMALEDLAMMRAVCGSTVLYPCDPNQTAQLCRRPWPTCRGSSTCAPPAAPCPAIRPGRAVPRRRQQDAAPLGRRPGDDRRRRRRRCTRRWPRPTSWRRKASPSA